MARRKTPGRKNKIDDDAALRLWQGTDARDSSDIVPGNLPDTARPSGTTLFESLRRARSWDWNSIGLVLSVKAVLLIFGGQSYQILSNQAITTWRGWLEIWNRWDATHYLALAELGYTASGERRTQIVLYPLYPWLTRLCAFLSGDFLLSAFIISALCSVAAALLLKHLVEVDYSNEAARASVWFMLIFPTSYFLHIPYTESLMLALTLGCFLAARKGRWAVAEILGALASLSRINGSLLVPALAVEMYWQYRKTRRLEWSWLWLLFIPAGLLAYLLLNRYVTGSMFTFMAVMKAHRFKELSAPWVGLKGAYDSMGRAPESAQMVGWQEFFFAILGFGCAIVSWFKLRPSYAMWMTCNWVLVTSTSFLVSVPRYTLMMFPIFILPAMLPPGGILRRAINVWSLLFLALFLTQFVQGRWAF